MTASEEAKALGFKSLTQVAYMFGVTTQCLRNWHRDSHDKFLIVLYGCLWMVNKDDSKNKSKANIHYSPIKKTSAVQKRRSASKRY